MSLRLYTAPVGLPITTADVKARLRVETSYEDAVIAAHIATAVAKLDGARGWPGIAIREQIWDLVLPAFPACGWIALPLPPLVSVTHVKYLDTALAEQTFSTASYVVTTAEQPARIVLADGASWPSTGNHPEAVTVRFVCGYPDEGSPAVSTVPDQILQAITYEVNILLDDPSPDEHARIDKMIDGLLVNFRAWAF